MSQKELEKNLKELLELSKKLREANKDLRNKNIRLKKENNRLKDNIELSRNKKELHIDKISERELIPQTSMNPFLHGAYGQMSNTNNQLDNSAYVNDISVQEKYLIPQNSNMHC